jgi:hypothetical protein
VERGAHGVPEVAIGEDGEVVGKTGVLHQTGQRLRVSRQCRKWGLRKTRRPQRQA